MTAVFILCFHYITKKVVYRTCKPPSQSVYSGVCHRLVITSKIAIGFRSGVRHRLTLIFKITIRLTLSRPLIYHKYNIDHHTHQEKKSNKKNDRENSIVTSLQSLFSCLSCQNCHSYHQFGQFLFGEAVRTVTAIILTMSFD